MKQSVYLLTLLLLATSCKEIKQRAKNTIKEGGEVVGKTAGEFSKGAYEGIEETFKVTVTLSEALQKEGVELGTITIKNDSTGNNNLLNVYMIFNKDIKREVHLKAYDKHGREMGRSSKEIDAKANEAGYYDFHFDPLTNINYDTKVTLE